MLGATSLVLLVLAFLRTSARVAAASLPKSKPSELSRGKPVDLEASERLAEIGPFGEPPASGRAGAPEGRWDLVCLIRDSRKGGGIPGAALRLDCLPNVSPFLADDEGRALLPCLHIEARSTSGPSSCDELQGCVLTVTADGYGPATAVLEGSAPIEQVILLDEHAELELVACGFRGEPLAGVEIRCSVYGSDLVRSHSPAQGVPLGRRVSLRTDEWTGRVYRSDFLGRHDWSATTNAAGTARITGLPPLIEVSISLREGSRHHDLGLRVLQPAQRDFLEWKRPEGYSFEGIVLGDTGLPADTFAVCIVQLERGGADSFLLDSRARVFARTETSAEGVFEFEHIPPGTWAVGPADAVTKPFSAPSPFRPTCPAKVISLPAAGRAEVILLQLQSPVVIQGRVVDSGDRGVARCFVVARCTSMEGQRTTRTDADGHFLFGPLPWGDYAIECWKEDGKTAQALWPSGSEGTLMLALP